MTPGTAGSSNWLTQTLSFGDSRLKVVLMQGRSSARAKPAAASRSDRLSKDKDVVLGRLPIWLPYRALLLVGPAWVNRRLSQ